MQNVFNARLLQKSVIAENTLEFELEKPKNFTFRPGQYVLVYFDGKKDIPPYAFSLASSPYERNLLITMRLSASLFKQTINSLRIGSSMQIKGPFGVLRLHENTNIPAVFIAGGIGITPFRSIILDEAQKNFPHTIYLVYCNKKIESSAYFKDFEKIKHPHFKNINVLEEPPKNWQGEIGLLNEITLKKNITDMQNAKYYIVGPPIMVEAVKKILLNMKISDDNIKIELFTGYGVRKATSLPAR